ncbi:MAG: GspE/PulE family protein [Clostridia bacterium]|nr:GspE/PulE family protein [Clostridia bacterium]
MNLYNEILLHLVYKKLIKKNQIQTILDEIKTKKMKLAEYLVENNICDLSTYFSILGDFLNIPFVDMGMLDVDQELLEKFSLSFLKKHKIVPICVDKNAVMLVAVGKPIDVMAKSIISTFYNGAVDYVFVPQKQIDTFIDSIVAVKSTANALSDLEREKNKKTEKVLSQDGKQFDKNTDVINAPAVRLIDSFIKEAIPFRASDIHIEPYENDVKVRYRIDGDLSDRVSFPIESYPAVCARLKIISGMNIAERRIPQDGRINMVVNGAEYDFRVSTLPTVYGEKFAIRILDKSSFNFSRKDLGFTMEENLVIDKILGHPHGLILLTGPTGCGKSTTLYSFLKEVNKAQVNIVTVEDPVEYTMKGVNQTQVNTKANMTFATALRSILRQDPDVIMIGEIRDEETAQIGIRAAITGHLVFSTLHTNDAPGAVTRLMDMGVSSYLVGDSIVGVISQRLVKKLCPMCKKKSKTTEKEMQILGLDTPATICRPSGCQFCNDSGYKGRMAVHEIMYVNEKLRNLINKKTSVEEIRKVAEENGMISLTDSCKDAVLNGNTSIAEYLSLNVNEN